MRVIIAGGRDFNQYGILYKSCTEILNKYFLDGTQDFEIISGGANGADALGQRYSKDLSIKL